MRLRSVWSSAALSVAFCSLSFGNIDGKVTLQGDPPPPQQIKQIAQNPQCQAAHQDPVYDDSIIVGDKGELANVIVFIKPAEGQKLEGPQKAEPVVLDQHGCMYSPHVVAVEVGQPVAIKNSDPFLHNVHSMAIEDKNGQFNFAQINQGEKKVPPFGQAETFQVKCDVHPWMKCIVRVFDHPFFAKTGDDGKYSIETKGLKDGSYTVQAWHEVYKNSEPQTVEIKDGKATRDVDFTFKVK
jgi:plastocyanin